MTHDDSHDIDASAHESDDVHDASEPTTDGEGPAGSMERRDYLRAVAAAAALGGLGGAATGGAAAETADTSLDIDERIEEHRTGDLEVVVENPDGSTVSDASVSVSQQEHDFGFGTAVNANTLINSSSEGDNYREYIPELFNKAVMENRHKWDFWENEQQLADEATEWILNQGLDMRGHVCIWGREDVAAIPDDILTAIDEGDEQTIRERSMAHIEEIITHYGEDFTEWEVVNEAMHAYQLQIGVYGDQIDTEEPWTGDVVPWTSDLLADWYDQAESVIEDNGLDVGIAVNDFNQFAYGYTDNRYVNEIQHINTNAVQLDTVGLQAHAGARTGEFNSNDSPDGRISAAQVTEEMNKWADLGARLKITEFDTYNGDDWNSDEERAEVLENYLRGAFSHPGCDDFIMWGFWDGRHWENEAPLFYDDWSTKPAYDVWTGLVYDEWWTDDSGATDASGTYATTAFLGDHEVTVSTDSAETTETVSVSDASGTTTVTVTLEGDGDSDGDTQPPETPTNLTATDSTSSSITVSWDGVTDNGTSGLDAYVVSVDGSEDQQVGAGMTTATIDGLDAATTYEIAVSAVDGAGNESETVTVEATTDEDDSDGNGDGDGDGDGDGEEDGDEVPDGDLIAEMDPSTTSPAVDERVTFRVTDTTDSGNWISSLEWDLGNGDTASGWYTETTYESAGTYTVSLTATNNDDESTTHEVEIVVGDGDGSDDGDGDGDGDSDGGSDDGDGDSDSDGDGTTGDLVAEIDPSTTEASVGQTVQFWLTDATGSANWITGAEWDLGNGDTGSGWYAETTYDAAGTYTVSLTATNNDDESTTDEVTITVS